MNDMTYGVCDRSELLARSGVEFLSAIADGRLPQPPICRTMGFALTEVGDGRVVFEGATHDGLGNPIGTVHGGFAATLLDSATACAVHTIVPKGRVYTTLELKVNFVRALLASTGAVRAEGTVVHRGRTVATSEARLTDATGRLYAHATSTCMIMDG
ncbi:MAG: PaaI family thioesterase [Pseudomonadota bacterium]